MDWQSEKQCRSDKNRRGKKTAKSKEQEKNILLGEYITQKLSAAKDYRGKGRRKERKEERLECLMTSKTEGAVDRAEKN